MSAWTAAALALAAATMPTNSGPEPACAEMISHVPESWAARSRGLLGSRVQYPQHAVSEGITGTVRLDIELDGEGRIHGVSVAQSSGEPALDQAALDAARTIVRFEALPCFASPRIRITIPVAFATVQ